MIDNSIKKIVYIGNFIMPNKNAAAHRVFNNALALKELGFDVAFCGIKNTKDDAENKYVGPFLNIPRKRNKGFLSFFSSRSLFKTLTSIKKIGFVIAYNMHYYPLKQIIRYCKKKNIKVIADVTEWYDNRLSINPVSIVKYFDTKLVMERLHKKVDGIISISSFLSTYYSNFVSNITIIPPLINKDDDIWHIKVPNNSQTVEFIYNGEIGNKKDELPLVIECFAKADKNKDFVFKIVGISRRDYLKRFPKSAEYIDVLGAKILFYGKVTHSQSVAMLRGSDYCVFFRKRTRKNMAGFPTKFVECVTAGTGILTNDFSDLRMFWPNSGGLLMDEINKEAIINGINSLIAKGKTPHVQSDIFDYRKYVKKIGFFFSKYYDNYE